MCSELRGDVQKPAAMTGSPNFGSNKADSATYGGSDLGITSQGWTLDLTWSKEEIAPTDSFGDTVIDGEMNAASLGNERVRHSAICWNV